MHHGYRLLYILAPLVGLALACNEPDDGSGSATVGQPTGGQPTGYQPTGGQPTTVEPTTGEPTGGEPTGGEPTGGEPTTGEPTGGEPTTGEPNTGGAGDGPVVMELLSNPSEIVAYKAVTFTAIVSDPDGLDTIVAGKLVSPDGAAFYGAFASLGGGTYQLVLAWDMINSASPINFTGATQAHEFKADFSDIDGNHATATISITLNCADYLTMVNECNGEPCASPAVCDGDCVDLDTDRDHCGQCGHDCGLLDCYFGQCT